MIDNVIELAVYAFFAACLLRAIKFGAFSPYFLIMIHFTLGIPIRYLVLKSTTDYYSTVLIDVIKVSSDKLFELSLGVMFFVISFEIFYAIRKKPKFALTRTIFSVPAVKKPNNSILRLISFSVVCFFIYSLLMISSLGGISGVIHAFSARVSDNIEGLAYTGILGDIFISSTLLLLYLVNSQAAVRPSYKYVTYTLVALALVLLLVQSGRGNLIQFILSIMIIQDLIKKRFTKFNFRILLIIFFVLIATVVGLATRYSAQKNVSIESTFQTVINNAMGSLSAPFALYDHYYLSTLYVSYKGHSYGTFYIENALRPIPRSIWPDKPLALGKLVRQQFWGDTQGGIPPGVFGEFYIEFGIFGTILLASIFGMFFSQFHKLFLYSYKDSTLIPFVAIISPFICFNLVRGGMDVGFTRIVIYSASFFLLACIYKGGLKLYRIKHTHSLTKVRA